MTAFNRLAFHPMRTRKGILLFCALLATHLNLIIPAAGAVSDTVACHFDGGGHSMRAQGVSMKADRIPETRQKMGYDCPHGANGAHGLKRDCGMKFDDSGLFKAGATTPFVFPEDGVIALNFPAKSDVATAHDDGFNGFADPDYRPPTLLS